MVDLVSYFGAAYLINRPERTDRRRSAAKELLRAGWELSPSSVQLYAARTFTDRAGFQFPRSRGCFHSHSECIRAAQLAGRGAVLIMEDDIALASSIPQLTPSIISQLESNPWDIFYLGHEHTGHIPRANARTSEVELVATDAAITGSHFWAVNGRIFSKILEHLDRVANGVEGDQEFGPMPIDGAFNVFRRKNSDVRTLLANPKLGWQRPSRSDNHPDAIDNFGFLRPLVATARNLKYLAARWRS